MTTRTPTSQTVSALLKRAGFIRSVSTDSHDPTTGFAVHAGDAGTVRVRYHGRGAASTPEYVREKTGQYAEVIRKAGFAAERGDNPADLTVSRACGATAYRPGSGNEMTACWLPETPHTWHENEYGRFDWDERNEQKED